MPIRRKGSHDTPVAPVSLTRRHFMQSSALAGTAMALGLPAFSARAAGGGQAVAIIGGGVAGLTAAHELAERGFQVSVYEQRAWGGKARSISAPGAAGAHSFQLLEGLYNNLPDTLQRIPFADSAGHVQGSMVQLPQTMLAAGGQVAYVNHSAGISFPASVDGLPATIQSWLQDAFVALDVPADELAFFVSKFHAFMTSSEARRLQQWEYMSWWDYVGAAIRSAHYQQLIGQAPFLNGVAHGKQNSASSVGQALEAVFYADARQGYRHVASNRLDRITAETWIDTWCQYLAGLGVSLNLGVQAMQFQYDYGRVTGVLAHASGQPLTIHADWYVLAVPSEKVAALMPAAMQEADSQFAGISQLAQRRVASVQFFLTESAPIRPGHFACLHSPWAVTGISQARLPPPGVAGTGGDGTVQEMLSLNVSDWTTPGVLYGLPADQCTREQIVQDVLAQLRHDLPNGRNVLPDRVIHAWRVTTHDDPLFVNTVGSWSLRPETTTAIPHFFLAGDYVRATGAAFASMEAANESGRRAANAIVAASGSRATPATIHSRYNSPLLAAQWKADAAQLAACQPNRFDLLDPYYPNCHL